MKKKIVSFAFVWGLCGCSAILFFVTNANSNKITVCAPTIPNSIELTNSDTLSLQQYKIENPVIEVCTDINTASHEQLELLPGIGEKMADRIIKYRSENGAFKQIDDLNGIKGIGKAKIAKIRNKVCF